MKWYATALAVLIATLWALSPDRTHAQVMRDPLIDPAEGGNGTRFQVVGQLGWTPGETVMLRVGFATNDPLNFAGPFPFERQITVLRDGTWSFPINVNDALLGAPLSAVPGFIVVRAEASAHVAVNAYVYTVNGSRPAGADAIGHFGFGIPHGNEALPLTLALFALGGGTLLVATGASRRMAR